MPKPKASFLLFIFLTMLQNKDFGLLKLSVVSKVNIPAVRAVIILVVNWPDTGSDPIRIPRRLKWTCQPVSEP